MKPSPLLPPDSERERFSSDSGFLLCDGVPALLWEDEAAEVDSERLVQTQLRDPGLAAVVKEAPEVCEADAASASLDLLSPV